MTGPGAPDSPPRLTKLYEQWFRVNGQGRPAWVPLGTAKDEVRALLAFVRDELQKAGFEPVEPVYQLLTSSVAGVISSIRPSWKAFDLVAKEQAKADQEAKGGFLDILGKSPKQARKVLMPASEEPQVAREELHRGLRGAVEALDQLIEALRPKPVAPVPVPWSEDEKLLAEFQRVFELSFDQDSGVFVRGRLGEVRTRLANQRGIHVLAYDDKPDLFDLSENPLLAPGTTQTKVPAILGDTGHSMRGQAFVPARRVDSTVQDDPVVAEGERVDD